MSDSNIITYTQREAVYVEGELAFKEGQPRTDNPYAASSPTLEQIWWNGWDTAQKEMEKRKRADWEAEGLK